MDDARPVPNWVFAVLHAPYGIVNGFFTITLGYLLAQAGVPTEAIAGIAALNLFPLTWSVVWAPVVDFTLSYRRWYVIGTAGTALGMAVAGLVPMARESVLLLGVLAFGAGFASTFTAQVTAAFAAHGEGKKGDAAGWFMAGSIGGIGAGGGLGLWVAHHMGNSLSGLVLAAICLACCAGLAFLTEPAHSHRMPRLSTTLGNIWREFLGLVRSRKGFTVCVLLILPMGTGAASNLWSAIAGNWHAGADMVALATGLAGGGASAVGALVTGRISNRVGAMPAYLGGVVVMALIAIAMAAAPRTPVNFAVFTLAYAAANGAMYTTFAAVMLESIGETCAATKAPLLTCLTNIPILSMTLVDGKAETAFGPAGMLLTESALGLAAMTLFLVFLAWMRTRPLAAAA